MLCLWRSRLVVGAIHEPIVTPGPGHFARSCVGLLRDRRRIRIWAVRRTCDVLSAWSVRFFRLRTRFRIHERGGDRYLRSRRVGHGRCVGRQGGALPGPHADRRRQGRNDDHAASPGKPARPEGSAEAEMCADASPSRPSPKTCSVRYLTTGSWLFAAAGSNFNPTDPADNPASESGILIVYTLGRDFVEEGHPENIFPSESECN